MSFSQCGHLQVGHFSQDSTSGKQEAPAAQWVWAIYHHAMLATVPTPTPDLRRSSPLHHGGRVSSYITAVTSGKPQPATLKHTAIPSTLTLGLEGRSERSHSLRPGWPLSLPPSAPAGAAPTKASSTSAPVVHIPLLPQQNGNEENSLIVLITFQLEQCGGSLMTIVKMARPIIPEFLPVWKPQA